MIDVMGIKVNSKDNQITIDYSETMKKWKELPNLYIDDLFKGSGKLGDK